MGLFLSDRRLELCTDDEFRILEFGDLDAAMRFVQVFIRENHDRQALQSILSSDETQYAIGRMTDDQLVRAIAQQLRIGRLKIIERRDRRRGSGDPVEAQQAAPPPPAPSPRSSSSSRAPEEQEAAVLPSDLESGAMASTMRQASEDGTAVCEVCARSAGGGE